MTIGSWSRAAMGAVLVVASAAGCGGSDSVACEQSISVSGWVVDLSQGLDNRSENTYVQFRNDTEDVFAVLSDVAEGRAWAGMKETQAGVDAMAAASSLAESIRAFMSSLDLVQWDLSRAPSRPEIVEAWSGLVNSDALARANVVERLVIDKCGLPVRITAVGDPPARLPDPSIPSPTATDPPTTPIDEDSESRAVGETVGALFGLELEPDEALCLGRQLAEIVDLSSASTDMAPYLGQFQKAFDGCNIDFRVPVTNE